MSDSENAPTTTPRKKSKSVCEIDSLIYQMPKASQMRLEMLNIEIKILLSKQKC